ncbi:MAG: MFS transporter [Hyphomicrobiales bacterium]|nr:MFS transporter [Hyphomicrobiales bacterium]MBV8824367.1 MFS transporter [Hyphomicrobiales bacterium]MBV9428178.1 MFS transporter [Bradyrhizobiaceae bacterium]
MPANADNRADRSSPPAGSPATSSIWSPFRQRAFAVLWVATVVSNIGAWMSSAASGWLMTSLNRDPLMVSLVQVATSLPMFLFALPAGTLADIIDRRHFLLGVEIATTIVATGFALLVSSGQATPLTLLVFTFLTGTCTALIAPAWQSIVPQLVPKENLRPAVAANSVGVNISRAVGPAVGGVITAALTIAVPFWLDAFSNLGVIGALLWWRSPSRSSRRLPAERFGSAIRNAFRHARNNPPLRSTLIRAAAFFTFASAYWALLPLVAREQIAGGPELYGVLLGAIGAGAVAGAIALSRLTAKFGANRLVAAGTLGTAVTLVLFGLARHPTIALVASVIGGVSWITVLSSINVSAQVALPEWVRARGLATYVTVFFGTMTFGSLIWGQVASIVGLPITQFAAAACILIAIPLTWHWKLQTRAGVDLSPSMHWPAPVVAHDIEQDQGPVMVMVEYRIKSTDRRDFLSAMRKLEDERRRDGAYAWCVFEDSAEQGRFVETFLVESWLEHLHQHERVTNADRVLQEMIGRYQIEGEPKVTHFIAASN